ncbi:MAG TPA: phosphoribosylaminoimidazolecarboxamide formyltransferase [Chloroflexi bacterium]|jgi:phosphoribosylaminoimidazolecarboxamide formyltransferase/IMP cyclohydrolase|nr:phosphoribosylaminoimidazolecarboxamide formyltransferase [Chloroflexota bacterium]
MAREMTLRYGMNPHQAPARVYVDEGDLPFEVLSGSPGYINLLDALNAWQLVRELAGLLNLPAAASFKHVSPAGAAVGIPLSETEARACFVDDMELSPLAAAYARARGADRMSSFGDWAALSHTCDVPTARLISREISDGVIAPDYEPKALEILRAKRGGSYRVLRIDPTYEPPALERRQVFGITLEQHRNDAPLGPDLFTHIVTRETELPQEALRDLIVATVALKYTQSNSVCLAYNGQVTGAGAGQQSRVHCTRLAANKSDLWFLRQHPAVLDLQFVRGLSRADKNNAIDVFLLEEVSPAEQAAWEQAFRVVPTRLTGEEKRAWLDNVSGVALSSDAFFPFRDSIDRAARSGVRYVAQPGGSLNDEGVIAACDEYGMVMALTQLRLFHH